MRIGTKWALLGVLALSTLGAAPVSASHDDRGDRCGSDRDGRSSSSFDRRRGNDLLVFGLTSTSAWSASSPTPREMPVR